MRLDLRPFFCAAAVLEYPGLSVPGYLGSGAAILNIVVCVLKLALRHLGFGVIIC